MDLPAIPPSALVTIAALAVAVVFAQSLAHAWRRWARRRKILSRVRRAGAGESLAAVWLERFGFEVLGAQVAATYSVEVDGAPVSIGVRADYLVRRGDARYVVEVKTGAVAPSIETPATRRQLLEYSVAFDVDGVLLLDAERQRVHAVAFPRGAGDVRAARRWWPVVALVFAVAAVIVTLRAAP